MIPSLTENIIEPADSVPKRQYTAEETPLILPPSNQVEILTTNEAINIQMLGRTRPMAMESQHTYVLQTRSKGMTVNARQPTVIDIQYVSPLNVRWSCLDFRQVVPGVWKLDRDEKVELRNENICGNKKQIKLALELIHESNGRISVKDIYEQLLISKSTLEKNFTHVMGITPKEYCKIEKLKNFIESYFIFPEETLTEITYRCGYYDQSHLIKDFKSIVGITPRKYFSSCLSSPYSLQLGKALS